MLLPLVIDKARSIISEKFRDAVIQRWSRYRANEFYSALCEALLAEAKSPEDLRDVDCYLTKLLLSEKASEVLFEAYRRVCLSASKSLGPRVIGILTAQITNEDRFADEDEELYFSIAESLNDMELRAFANYFRAQQSVLTKNSKESQKTEYELIIKLGSDSIDSSWSSLNRSLELGSFGLESVGSWAVKLRNPGKCRRQVGRIQRRL